MEGIIIATLVIAVVGLIIGLGLVMAGNKFSVETDEREEQVREYLPGNNCGACGYAGCDAVAAAIVAGEVPVNACPVNNEANVSKIAEIMGVEASATVKKVAVVKCAGDCGSTSNKCNFVGIRDCRSAVMAGISIWECDYGCLGYGSCVNACTYGGIRIQNGVAVVDPEKCMGCGACAAVCPKGLIELVPSDKPVAVKCSNKDRGPEVKKVCTAGCIGCKICTKQCESEAITVEGNLAHIDYEKCTGCEKCAEKCPSHVIRKIHE